MLSKGVSHLLKLVGIEEDSFEDSLEFVLTELFVLKLYTLLDFKEFSNKKDAVKILRDELATKYKLKLETDKLLRLYHCLKEIEKGPVREAPSYGVYLDLIYTSDLKCAECGKKPPEVVLVIDHIKPVKHFGNTARENLRFLCKKDNLKKGGKIYTGSPCLDLV